MNLADNFKLFWNFSLSFAIILDLMASDGVFSEHIPTNRRMAFLPHIYTSGTHREVGTHIGLTFKNMIEDLVSLHKTLNQVLIPAYNTVEGKQVFDSILSSVEENFPQYVDELRGYADGSGVSFESLFLLNVENIFIQETRAKANGTLACSSLCMNRVGEKLLGHTEDVAPFVLNHVYLVTARITNKERRGKWKKEEEKFTSFCYAGYLPGFAMSFNEKGLVNSVNVIQAEKLYRNKTPRMFLCRAALSAGNIEELREVLLDKETGAGEALSMNFVFYEEGKDVTFHNVEVAPPLSEQDTESRLSFEEAKVGNNLYHFNSYQRIKDIPWDPSSKARYETYLRMGEPNNREEMLKILGDTSGEKYKIFKEPNTKDMGVTVVVGLFDLINKVYTIFPGNPIHSEPIAEIQMKFSSL